MTARRVAVYLLPAAALVLVALCLRAPFTVVGPLVRELSDELGLSTAALAAVTSLPLVCFAVVSPFAPALAGRFGVHRAVVIGAALLGLGIVLRSGGAVGLFVGTAVLTAGIAIVNVLLPAVARAEYGRRSAAVIGATTASMALSASIGAGLAEPLAAAVGDAFRSLALWLIPAAVALVAVALLAARRPHERPDEPPPTSRLAILRDRVALAVMLYFGLQSMAFYVLITWLPDVLEQEAGLTAVQAGAVVAAVAALGAPLALVVPPLATRRPTQAWWALGAGLCTLAGVLGLVFAPAAAPVVWAVMWGIGSGCSFPLAFTMFLERARDVTQTGRLSAGAQSVGYLVAALGPLGLGLLHEATGGWTAGLAVLAVCVVGQCASGVLSGLPRKLSPTV